MPQPLYKIHRKQKLMGKPIKHPRRKPLITPAEGMQLLELIGVPTWFVNIMRKTYE